MEKDINRENLPIKTTSKGELKFGITAKTDLKKMLKSCDKQKVAMENLPQI